MDHPARRIPLLLRLTLVCCGFVLAACAAPVAAQGGLRAEVEALNAQMVQAFRTNPASVSRFYTDDAEIVGGGTRVQGRARVDEYWAAVTGADWSLQIRDVGGDRMSPWVRGVSRLTGRDGRVGEVEYLAILARQPDGSLRYRIDMYTIGERRAPAPARPE
jgi:ketosteroid isomerase-like protein